MDLILFKYNNYYNRIWKTINKDEIPEDKQTIKNVSFNTNNGIVTTQITPASYLNKYDYAVLSNGGLVEQDSSKTNVSFSGSSLAFISLFRYAYKAASKSSSLPALAATNSIYKQMVTDGKVTLGTDYKDLFKYLLEAQATLGLSAYLEKYVNQITVDNLKTYSGYATIMIDYKQTVDTTAIVSRWFILSSRRLRTNQYELTLKRDIMADYSDEIDEATLFINRSHLEDSNDLICNDEGWSFNQIKTNEMLLKGTENPAFIVGYLNPKTTATSVTVQGNNSVIEYKTLTDMSTDLNIPLDDLKTIFSQERLSCTTDNVEINFGNRGRVFDYLKAILILDNNYLLSSLNRQTVYAWSDPIFYVNSTLIADGFIKAMTECLSGDIHSVMYDMLKAANGAPVLSISQYQNLINYISTNNIKYNDVVYKYDYSLNVDDRTEKILASTDSSAQTFIKLFTDKYTDWTTSAGNLYIWAQFSSMTLSKQTIVTPDTVVIPLSSNRRATSGSTANIFAIPYNSTGVTIVKDGSSFRYNTIADNKFVKKIASTLATQLDKDLYDIQLLPYSTYLNEFYNSTTKAREFDPEYEGIRYDVINDGSGTPVSIIYWQDTNEYNSSIEVNLGYENRKVDSNTKFIKICGPNGSNGFEMNVAKNNGLDKIYVKCTFKPYQPYLQLLPNFKGLYGYNFNDYRGLICSDNFSLGRTTEAFIQYELNNKNYREIFKNQLGQMETQYNINKAENAFGRLSGIVTSTSQGAVSGFMMSGGNPYVAIAGAAIGGTTSAIGAGMDAANEGKNYNIGRNQTISNYNLNLGNIKAQPATITNDSFNIVSKIYPYIEFYECSAVEREAFENKIKYNGMITNTIGQITRHPDDVKFFQASVIRIDVDGNAEIINEINNELQQGGYC